MALLRRKRIVVDWAEEGEEEVVAGLEEEGAVGEAGRGAEEGGGNLWKRWCDIQDTQELWCRERSAR